jgi:AmmeMemoRadiSam system protein B
MSASLSTRPAAVAGAFYPAAAAVLRRDVARLLESTAGSAATPKALVVPHAGYVYSGAVAATAYAQLRNATGIHRVVLIGPSHRVGFHGLAVPSVDRFETPLGSIAIDADLRRAALAEPGVIASDRAHELEHSLEVQLPFLQSVLADFTLLPLVAGDAAPREVARVLERVWGGRETLLVISTDLSHFLDYQAANARDAATCRRIATFATDLDGYDACGCIGLNGFLLAAHAHGLTVRELARCNSGDTAGDRNRVVGYGAFGFYAQELADD